MKYARWSSGSQSRGDGGRSRLWSGSYGLNVVNVVGHSTHDSSCRADSWPLISLPLHTHTVVVDQPPAEGTQDHTQSDANGAEREGARGGSPAPGSGDGKGTGHP